MCAKEDDQQMKRQVAFIRQRTVSDVHEHGDDATIEAVCMECFKFLKALAKDFFDVQERSGQVTITDNWNSQQILLT